MNHIAYFKLQAKNLFRDYKTQTSYIDDGNTHYRYTPKYFDIESIFFDFEELDEENFSLMKAQHLLATMLGFKKWSDLLNASAAAQELAKLRWDNQDKIPLGEWDDQIADVGHKHNASFDPESELEYFKHCLSCHEGYGSAYSNYLLNQNPSNAVSKQPIPREVTIVKGVTPLHYTKRDVEKFQPSDEAWISWDGKKALPVILTEVDDVYYTFKIERPLKSVGNEHYLRLDEVRSTPELACINCVTS